MPTTRLNLPQQFGRFLLAGAFIFAAAFWGTSLILVFPLDGHRNLALLRLILKAAPHQPLQTWLQNLETMYIPFFLRQRSLMSCYFIAASLAWLAAFFFDGRILRKENTL